MTIFKVEYAGGTEVEVQEEDAHQAFFDYGDDYGWENYEDNRLEAAERAARAKLSQMIDDLPEGINFEVGECKGVWPQEEERDGRAMTSGEVYEIIEEFADELEDRGFDVDVGTTGGTAEFYASIPAAEYDNSEVERKINISCNFHHQ